MLHSPRHHIHLSLLRSLRLFVSLGCLVTFDHALASEAPTPPFFGTCSRSGGLTLALVGDVYPGARLLNRLGGPPPAFELLTRHSDFLIGNLEGALTTNENKAFPEQPFHHRMNPSTAKRLRDWGIDAVTLANNHAMDFGEAGLTDTKKALQKSSIKYAGAGQNWGDAEKPIVLTHNGMTVHILSFNLTFPKEAWATAEAPGVAYPWPERLRKRVETSAQEADFVIVSFHWGQELRPALRDYQPRVARLALEAGAHFVYGHHAHIPQALELSAEGRVIAYGLGNFLFDSYSPQASFGLAALLRLCPASGKQTTSSLFIPLLTNNAKTGFATRAMTEKEFEEASRPYREAGLFADTIRFWIPPESPASESKPPTQSSESSATN